MKDITYKTAVIPSREQIQNLYTDANWTSYTEDMDNLMKAINNSLEVITAWDGDNMVGLVRSVGDGQTILYIQDILVMKDYKRQGIGSKLLNKMLDSFPQVRQKVLLTDDVEETRSFYKANGFISCDDGRLVAFAKFSK